MGDIGITGARCRDLDAWHRAVLQAPDLSTSRHDGRPRISSSQVKLVLLAMRAYFDGAGPGKDAGAHGRPGRDRLADELDVSPATVQHAWAAGVAHGYLVQTARGHTGQSAEYAATLPTGLVPTTTPDAEGGSRPPQLSTMGGSGPPQSGESVGRDHGEGWSGPPPPPHDLEPPPPPAGAREDRPDPGGGGGIVRDACQILAQRELDAELTAGTTIRSRSRWLAAKVARLLETHGADLAAFAQLVDADDGTQLLTAWDADRTQQRIAASARTLAHTLAHTSDHRGPLPRDEAEGYLRSRWGHNEAAVIAGLDAFDHARQQQDQEVHA